MGILVFIKMFGAVMLLLYAVRMVRTGFERAAGPTLRRAIGKASSGPVAGALSGTAVAILLQSATAVAILAAGFATSGFISTAAGLAVLLGADLGSALVVQFLALSNRDLELGDATLVEVELERHHRHSLPLNGLREARDLALVQQQAAWTAWIVLEERGGLTVLGDVRVDQEDAAVLDRGIALRDIGLARAQRLDLGTGELEAGLEDVANGKLVACAPVLGDGLTSAGGVVSRHLGALSGCAG